MIWLYQGRCLEVERLQIMFDLQQSRSSLAAQHDRDLSGNSCSVLSAPLPYPCIGSVMTWIVKIAGSTSIILGGSSSPT